ncbi:hypothetical protein L1887_36106 [Cichorium endivia]|nr:hypothetical protein L1887_36106 [Cichorium endivia]
MESGDSKKRKRKSVQPEAKSKATYVDLSSSRKSTLKAQNVVEVSSNKSLKVKKGKIVRVYPATSYWSGKKVGLRLKSLQHFGDVDVIETYKDNVDDDVSQIEAKEDEGEKEDSGKEEDDVILDKGKKVVEDVSEKDVREKDDVSEDVVKSVDHNSDFDVIIYGSRSLEIVLVDDEDLNDVTPEKDNELNEEGTSGKENELSVTQLLDDPIFCAEIERNALAVISKKSTTPVIVTEGLVGSVGIEDEVTDEELIEASKIISQIHSGKQEVQVNVDFTTLKDAIRMDKR